MVSPFHWQFTFTLAMFQFTFKNFWVENYANAPFPPSVLPDGALLEESVLTQFWSL